MFENQLLGNVLVIGGCGFLGHHIVKDLIDSKRTSNVSVFDVNISRNRFENVFYANGDLCSASEVNNVLNKVKPRVIIHTASPVAHHHKGIAIYEKVNVQGTTTLLECAQKCGTVKAFVYTSSASVVHDYVSDLFQADESLPVLRMPEQHEPYAHTKGIADDLVLAANKVNGDMLTCSVRPASIFGEGDPGTLESMILAAKSRKTRFQIGNGENLFDFTYVKNVSDAHIIAASALLATYEAPSSIPADVRVDGEAFFVTNDEPIPFWDFTRAVGAAAGFPTKKEEVWVIPRWVGMMMGTVSEWVVWAMSMGTKRPTMTKEGISFSCITRTYKIDKAKRRLGYRPGVSLHEGIQRGADWWVAKEKEEEAKKGK